MTRRAFLLLLVLTVFGLISPLEAFGADKPAPAATRAKIGIDTGTAGSVKPVRLSIGRDSTPLALLGKLSRNRDVPIGYKQYSFGTLLLQAVDRRNDGSPPDPENPNDQQPVADSEEGKAFYFFVGPSRKVKKQGRKLILVATEPIDLQAFAYMPQGAGDGLDRTKLRKQRPYVPLELRSDPDPKIQRQLLSLMRTWDDPTVIIAYRATSDFDPSKAP